MLHLPWIVPAGFMITLFAAIALFVRAARNAKPLIVLLIVVAVIQTILGLSGFYRSEDGLTSRFPLLVMPMLLSFFSLFFFSKGRALLAALDIRFLTLLHIIRIGVELVLSSLYQYDGIPRAMTFHGRNFDILSGLTAILVFYFAFVKRQLGWKALIGWNIACVLLLLNVVSAAILSLPARYSRFGFEQPNIAVGFFPYSLLPAILVPLVLFAHAATIRQLIQTRQPI